MEYEVEGARPTQKTWTEMCKKTIRLNREDTMDRNRWRQMEDDW